MESYQLQFRDLLKRAVSEPGTISAAYSAFHNYSIGNQLAALVQCSLRKIPVGPISTLKDWNAKGRFVKRGEKAIWLCMPITGKKNAKVEATGEETPDHLHVLCLEAPLVCSGANRGRGNLRTVGPSDFRGTHGGVSASALDFDLVATGDSSGGESLFSTDSKRICNLVVGGGGD
jgi:hypothetical protein